MILRSAAAADVDVVAELEHELFGSDAWSRDQVRDELIGGRRHVWVAGGPVRGYVVVRVVDDVADLHRIGVHPGHRRRGVARMLLDQAMDAAVTDGAVRLLLEVAADNDGALAFYGSVGFVEIGRRARYYRSGADAVVMERRLSR
ncbi:MAG: ribosomal protein S18-alanine N-acetyltransferase [Nocardioides sp.]|nr:ribosomal protein S18-alanine N-acetyltransferase [Nocardioidaceae bacterium]